MQRRQVFDSRQAAGAAKPPVDDGKKNGGYRLNFGEGDTTDNASSSVGRSKLKRFGEGETGATGGYSLDEENSNKRQGAGTGMVRYGATPGSGASSSGIPSASAGKRSTSLPRHKQAPPTRLGTARGTGTAGAVDEDAFITAFDDVPKVNVFSAKELVGHMQQIREALGDPNTDWEKRIDFLKKLRSLLLADAVQYDEFWTELRSLEIPFQLAVKDLRSQVVREACITIAFFSQQLGMKFDHFAESTLPALINLIQNSAKVMATSGLVACNFIIKYTHAPKLIPIITSSLNSKSREIRRACADIICHLCHTWPTHALERHCTALQEAVRQGLSDADPDARLAARKAYWGFHSHFKDQADAMFLTLDAAKQRQLRGELSQSSSNNSIAAGGAAGPLRASQENLRGGPPLQTLRAPGRSTSDIDTGAQRRARGGYMATLAAQAARSSRAPGVTAVAPHNMNSLPRTPKVRQNYGVTPSQTPTAAATAHMSSVNGSATRAMRTPNKSISQPGSRSGSPTSRLPTSASGSVARKYRPPNSGYSSGLPVRSHGGSREHSPPRSGVRRYSTEENGQTPPSTARYLTHETDIGALLTHRRINNPESMDLESETSSVCSERSFSANATNRQMHLDNWELSEALKNCQSSQWSERKDGLMYMLSMFKSRRPYTQAELKKICDAFSRLFVDQHNKTFCMFLDTLVEFLAAYRNELHDWLYILLVRLLTKQSSDLLASVQTKLTKTLGVVRESFPYQLQFSTLIRYIVDPANTPSLKMKVVVLNYLNNLACVMDSSHLKNTSDVRQAILKVVQWTAEPKSAEVRRASQNLLVALFSTNASEFTSILGTFPKSNQDSVYRLLQSQLVKPAASPQGTASGSASGAKSRTSMSPGPFGMGAQVDMDYVHDSLKRTSEEIQQYSFSGLQKVIGSQDSGIVDAVDSFQRVDNDLNSTRLLMEQLCMNSDEERQQEIITDILTELSNHNARTMERRKAMSTLKYMTRDGTFTLWDEHFKAILLILLETLGDNDPEIRSAALRVLAEICLSQAPRFRDYAELTILRVVDAHKDDDKEVVRSAEECAGILAAHLPPAVSLRILIPIIKNEDTKAMLAAIKMITKALEKMSATEAEVVLPDIIPLVIKAYEHPTQSVIRKASVVCLVAFHQLLGVEKLEPYLSALNNSKLKLLNLYIKRAETNSASPTSQI